MTAGAKRAAAGLLALLVGAAAVVPASAQDGGGSSAASGNKVRLNLEQASLRKVADTIADITGRNFVLDPRVEAKVTVIAQQPVTPDAAYELFLTVLDVHNYTVVEGENASRIVPAPAAETVGASNDVGAAPTDSQQYVTRVFRVDHVGVQQIIEVLGALVPSSAHLAAHPPSNALIAVGNDANIKRLKQIVEAVDQPVTQETEVVRLDHAAAEQVVNTLKAMKLGAKKGRRAPQIAADGRSNAVIIGGPKPVRLELRGLIAQLDRPVSDGSAGTEVVYLRYAEAKKVAKLLRGLAASGSNDGNGKGGGTTQIQAAKGSNALVIDAPRETARSLASIAAQLDVRRAQVLVEAIIVEVSLDRLRQLGVQWGVDGRKGAGIVGLSQFSASPNSGSLSQIVGSLAGGQVPPVGDGATVGAASPTGNAVRFAAVAQALGQNSATEVLSTPSIVTLDNQEAEIVVAQKVPFVTGRYTSSGDSQPSNPFQTIKRKDVGLTLRVTPQINEGDAVRLDITQEVSSLTASASAAGGEITNRRKISTEVMVEDGGFVVLGGLISDETREVTQRVPGLGRLPVLGNLFRYRSAQEEKRSLLVFIRPQILRSQADATAASRRKYTHLRGRRRSFQESQQDAWPSADGTPVPPLEMRLPPPFDARKQTGGPSLPPAVGGGDAG